MKNKITIGACWDGRDYYPVEYVNILYASVCCHTTVPFDFVLYIGPQAEHKRHLLNPKINIVQTGLPYWWSGMNFWRVDAPGITTEKLLYLDLDQVIVGSLDDIILYPSNACYMKDYPARACPPGKEKDANVAVTLLKKGAHARVWEEYVKAGAPQWDPLNISARAPLRMAAQGLVNDLKLEKDIFPEEWIISYKLWAARENIPADCRIVSFHGRPKPHELAAPWVKEYWRE